MKIDGCAYALLTNRKWDSPLVISLEHPNYIFRPFALADDEAVADELYCIECRTKLSAKVPGYRVFVGNAGAPLSGDGRMDGQALDDYYRVAEGAAEFFLHEWIEVLPDSYKEYKEGRV